MDKSVQLLDQILEAAHPQMVQSLYLAAVPDWFTLPLFATLRQIDDGRNEGILERCGRYSFFERFGADGDNPVFSLRAEERDLLQRRWIGEDPAAYRSAHARVLFYWQANPDPNPFAQAQNELYHLLFVNRPAGIDHLISHFRAYSNERQLAAIERLINTADRAYTYLSLLEQENDLPDLADLLIHLRARLAQLRGHWTESLARLEALRNKAGLSPRLQPYVVRAYGQALAHTGDQAGAMEQYRLALATFEQQAGSETAQSDPATAATLAAERAHTLIVLGDAYVALATTVGGGQQETAPAKLLTAVSSQFFNTIRAYFYAFLSLPLLVYLSFGLGRQVWRPRFWPQLHHLDWIIARLFAQAARFYSTADPLLETYGQPAEAVVADEKLAFLYLAVGDPYEAGRLFRYLLTETEATLSPYRRARIQVGLGEALLRLEQTAEAENLLQSALPLLREYEDQPGLAEATLLLAQAQAAAQPQTAVTTMQQALRLYQTMGDEVRATDAAERLALLATRVQAGSSPAAPIATEETTAIILSRRSYPVRYRHPTTVLLQRLLLVLLTVVAFLIPISTIRLETGTTIEPQILFNIPRLIRPDQPDLLPQLSQGVAAVRLTPIPNPEVLIWLGLLLFGGYLLLSTGLGLLALMRTSPAQVQASRQARTVRLTPERLYVGSDELAYGEMDQLTRANVRIWADIVNDHSQTAVDGNGRHLIIQATTNWYQSLVERVEQRLPQTAKRPDLSYRMLSSKLGAWYLLTLLLFLFWSLLGLAAPDWMMARSLWQPYSLVDLYPYTYLGLIVPPLWWFVIRPLHIHSQILPQSAWPWWFGLAGAVIGLLRLGSGFHPWFTVPDIYPPLLIISLLVGAAVVLWQRPRLPGWQRLAVLLIALLLLLPHAVQFSLDVAAYHHLVVGHAYRDQALAAADTDSERDEAADLRRAIAAYTRAHDLAVQPILGIDRLEASKKGWGIPPRSRHIWLAALNSRAALYSQLGHLDYPAYQLAIDDYLGLLRHVPDRDRIYASLALTYQSLGTVESPEEDVAETIAEAYDQAINNFERAINEAPDKAAYYLWLGVAQHALGQTAAAEQNYLLALAIAGDSALTPMQQSQAYTGLGRLAYSRGDFEAAAEWYRRAIEADPDAAAAHYDLGYLNYNDSNYEVALMHWDRAAQLLPHNPNILFSQGTLLWRLGTLNEAGEWMGGNPCALTTVSEGEQQQRQQRWEEALARYQQAAALPDQLDRRRAYTYRTMGQVTFLLRDCPDYKERKAETVQQAVDWYSEAITLDRGNPLYWHMRGRLRYVVWLNLPPGMGPSAREPLLAGLADQEQALALDPQTSGDYQPQRWFDLLYREGVEGTLTRGDDAFAAGNYELARGYYELVAQNRTENARAAFKTGLTALVQGDEAAAQRWYETGLERAAQTGDEAAIQEAGAALQAAPAVPAPARDQLRDELGVDAFAVDPTTPATAFALGLAAVEAGDYAEAAGYYETGLRLAAEIDDSNVTRQAANALRDFLLENERLPVTAVYWPLHPQSTREVTPALTDLNNPDLYWRFRADFSLRFITEPFKQRPPGEEADFESVIHQIIDDAARAAARSDIHQARYEFYRDANMGWLYLQRAEQYYQAGDFWEAAADYLLALEHIVPRTRHATNDYTGAAFGLALTAVALGDADVARIAFNAGLELAQENNNRQAVQQAHNRLQQLLSDQPRSASLGQPFLNLLAETLAEW